MDAIAYIRWSTEDQKRGDSERRQLGLARQVCEQRGYNLAEVIIESGRSAYHGKNRVEGGKLNDIEKRAARGELVGKVLIVELLDRLSRQHPYEGTGLLMSLTKCGITVVEAAGGSTWTQQSINDRWQDLLTVFIKAGIAYEASHDKAKRVASAWRKTQEIGRTKESDFVDADKRICPPWMKVVDGQRVIIEARAAVVRRIYQMCIDGMGLRSIAIELNKDKANTRWTRGEWTQSYISLLLRGRKALGEYLPKSVNERGRRMPCGEWRPMYDAIITQEIWLRAQASLDSRNNCTGGPHRMAMVNVLQGFVYCAHHNDGQRCGAKLTTRSADGRRSNKRRLVCSSYHRGGGCTCGTTYDYDSLFNGVLDNVLHLALPAPMESNAGESSVAVAQAELARKRARMDQLADKLIEQDDPVMQRAYDRFKQQIDEDAADLKRLQAIVQQDVAKRPSEELIQEIAALRAALPTDEEARRRTNTALREMIDGIFLNPATRAATIVMLEGRVILEIDKQGKLVRTANMHSSMDDETTLAALAANNTPKALALQRYKERNAA